MWARARRSRVTIGSMLHRTARGRKSVAILCLALVVFATVIPTAAVDLYAILVPLWLIVLVVAITVIRTDATRSDEQAVALLSVPAPRAPPSALASA
jgi:hypothetical protein